MNDLLNPHQKKAIETVNGRVLILAGAGSGKTRVLTMRMAHLVQNLNVSPKSILGLTFTNKAAAEMRHRVAGLLDKQSAKQMTLCTFHSFCMEVLRKEIHRLGYTKQFSLYNEHDNLRLIKLIARDILEHEGELPSLATTVAAIAQAKNRGWKPEELPQSGSWNDQFTRTVYQRLQDSMRAYNAVDFDSLLWLTVELFEKYPDVLDAYQEQYRYLMIDEYQDTNPIQYRLAALLSAKYGNLCVVGDDDQSIYGWRGADVKNILQFEKATVIKLEQNYRSTNTILKGANAVIRHNQSRHQKVLWSHCGEGEPIEVFHAPTDVNEAEAVVSRLVRLRSSWNLHWKDFAILYRSNALSRNFEVELLKHHWRNGDQWLRGVPYQIFGGLEFYERREVKDLFAYLRVIANPLDHEAILRIINQPRRGVGEGTLDHLTALHRSQEIPLWQLLKRVSGEGGDQELGKAQLHAKSIRGIRQFVEAIETAQEAFARGALATSMQQLIDRIDYKKAIIEEVKSDQMRDFKWENVEEFISTLADFEQSCKSQGKEISLSDFITGFPLDHNHQHHQSQLDEDKVNLLTFHSAKGLEFKVCFLVGMEDHILPHEKSVQESGLEEERRLMYVAMTRAMKYLVISMARQRKRMGKDCKSLPSRFLHEIPKELLKPTSWDGF